MNSNTMKNIKNFRDALIPAVLLLPMLVCSYKSKEEKKTQPACLEISGSVIEPGPDKSARVYLIEENQVVDSALVSGNEDFKFRLLEDRFYALRIEQEGYVSRLVSVSTFIPEDVRANKLYRFHFDLYAVAEEKQSPELNDVLDFPIAVIKYDEVKGYFDYNAQYTSHIKKVYSQLKHQSNYLFTTSY